MRDICLTCHTNYLCDVLSVTLLSAHLHARFRHRCLSLSLYTSGRWSRLQTSLLWGNHTLAVRPGLANLTHGTERAAVSSEHFVPFQNELMMFGWWWCIGEHRARGRHRLKNQPGLTNNKKMRMECKTLVTSKPNRWKIIIFWWWVHSTYNSIIYRSACVN